MLDKNLLNDLLSPYFEHLEKLCNLRRAHNLPFEVIEKSFNLTFKQEYFVLKKVYKIERSVLKGYLKRLYASMTQSVDINPVMELPPSINYEIVTEQEQAAESKEVAVRGDNAVAVNEVDNALVTDKAEKDGQVYADGETTAEECAEDEAEATEDI